MPEFESGGGCTDAEFDKSLRVAGTAELRLFMTRKLIFKG